MLFKVLNVYTQNKLYPERNRQPVQFNHEVWVLYVLSYLHHQSGSSIMSFLKPDDSLEFRLDNMLQ